MTRTLFLIAVVFCLTGFTSACGDENSTQSQSSDADMTTSLDFAPSDTGTDPCLAVADRCETEGAQRCGAGLTAVEVCSATADGCSTWAVESDCGLGFCDDSAAEIVCQDICGGIAPEQRCEAGESRCEGDRLMLCDEDQACPVFVEQVDCSTQPGVNRCDDSGPMARCGFGACLDLPPDEVCDAVGVTCEGSLLTICAENAFGCLITSVVECDRGGDGSGSCDASATPACLVGGDPCEGVSPDSLCDPTVTGAQGCDGPLLWTCEADAFGCMVRAEVDCEALAGDLAVGYCDASEATAACAIDADMRCEGKTPCGPDEAPGAWCDEVTPTTVVTCGYDEVGCVVRSTTDCSDGGANTEICNADDAGMNATCGPPCDSECDPALGSSCAGTTRVDCDLGADGCHDLVTGVDCASTGQVCGDIGGGVMDCGANGTGLDCTDAFLIQGSTTISGPDFAADYPNNSNYIGTDCFGRTTAGPEAVFAVSMQAGEQLTVSETGSLDVIFHIQEVCGGSERCLYSEDTPSGGEATGAEYIATGDTIVYVTLESYYNSTSQNNAYTFNFELYLPVCGDGIIDGLEQCDDGNSDSTDACADCVVNGDPDACGGLPTITDGFVIAGLDFYTDFADDFTSDSTCGPASNENEAVFEVYLLAGETLWVREYGDIDIVMAIQGGVCGAAGCLDSYDGGNSSEISTGLQYTAATEGTYHVVAAPYFSSSSSTSYELHFDIVGAEQCDNGLSDDFDDLIDCADPDCFGAVGLCDVELLCADGLDNDGDGAIDCVDTECFGALGCTTEIGYCGDGLDNDADGDTDCADADCSLDSACIPGETCADPYLLESGVPLVGSLSSVNSNDYSFNCGFGTGVGDLVYQLEVPDGTIATVTATPDNNEDLVVALAFSCAELDADSCFIEADSGGAETVVYENTSGGDVTLYAVVDTLSSSATFVVTASIGLAEVCSGGGDEDNDTLVDCADPDCFADPVDCLEEVGLCGDGADNDGDGVIDCADPDCFGDGGSCSDEIGYCDDGADNDGDGDADCADSDCAGIGGCAPGETCGSALPLPTDGTVITGSTATASDDYSDSSCGASSSPELIYEVWVGSDEAVTVTLTGTDGVMQPALAFALNDCNKLTTGCDTESDLASTAPKSLLYENLTGTDVTLFVVVSSAVDGAFELTATSTAIVPPDFSMTSAPAAPIDPPSIVVDTITMTDACTIDSVRVGMNITHTFLGDLEVGLKSPAGTTVMLQTNVSSSEENIIGTYPTTLIPSESMTVWAGEPSDGVWELTVDDSVFLDSGMLNDWSVYIYCQ